MSGFNPDSRLKLLGEVLSGDSTKASSVDEKLLSDENTLKMFIDGLRGLPTSLLQVALDNTDFSPHSEAEIRESIAAQVQQDTVHPTSNRALVDTACDAYLKNASTRLEEINILEQAGMRLEDAMIDMAQSRDEEDKEQLTLSDTIQASDRTTLSFAMARPGAVLSRRSRLSQLRDHDPLLARIYVLFEYSGRTHAEIATLLDMPLSDVVHSENVATVEVCMED